MMIESPRNPQVKDLVRLQQRRYRQSTGLCLVEGLRELQYALRAGLKFYALYYCPALFSAPTAAEALLTQFHTTSGQAPIPMGREAFEKASLREGPDGLLGVAYTPEVPVMASLALPPQAVLLVLQGIEKPGNLGAILRSADAAGVTAVILCDCPLEPSNPNVIRASQGLVFCAPVYQSTAEGLWAYLKEHSIPLYLSHLQAAQSLWQVQFPGRFALAIGSEKEGLPTAWRAHAQQSLKIPQSGQADSLNASVAAAVVLFEAARQRAKAASNEGV